ncbi:HesB/YadR/YfhF family protein [Neobacillus sp. K501]
MLISIDERAVAWFNKEFEINKPFTIRLYPQYAGFGEKHKGYSLAFSAELPSNAGYTTDINGITFYVEGNDVWFFENTETYLSVNDLSEEIFVTYTDPAIIN